MTSLKYLFYSLVLSVSLNNISYAENSGIREISSIETDVLADQAKKSNKRLMIVYYKDSCTMCDELSGNKSAAGMSAASFKEKFAVYKTDVAKGFNVTCPNDEDFNENEFMAIKGITKLPAVVVTDSYGNVTLVENNITSGQQLFALGEKLHNRRIAGKF